MGWGGEIIGYSFLNTFATTNLKFAAVIFRYLITDVMDTDLSYIIRSGQPITPSHVKFFLYQTLRGLKYIHSVGIVHRDIKPKNLLISKTCDLKICDFGLARLDKEHPGFAVVYVHYRLQTYLFSPLISR